MLQLYIGNKNYSSWSMRAWVLMRQAGIEFEEISLRFDGFDADSQFKQRITAISPAGKVPVLVDGETVVWDTLAIAEYLAERFPDVHLWPRDPGLRAHARSVCAEMHSGFGALRSLCPMNIEARLHPTGKLLWRDHAALRADVARLIALWSQALERSTGPMLFGPFTVADAFFAPVCSRIQTYGLPLPPQMRVYADRVLGLAAVRAWSEAACAEHDFLDFEEPYRLAPAAP